MARRTGPLARVNLFRFGVLAVIAVTAVLSFTLQAGILRFLFRGALVVGAVLLFGSYLLELWRRRRQVARDRARGS
jgi:hypothetical protein